MTKMQEPWQFSDMIGVLMRDQKKLYVSLSVADLEVLMSAVLGTAAYEGVPDELSDNLLGLAKELSDIIEYHHPEVEPYLAYIFGAVVFHRAMRDG